jgi:hypothetical protein
LDLVGIAWGSRRLAAGCVGSGRGLTALRSLGVATGPDPASARPEAARLVTEPLMPQVRHTSSAGRWLGAERGHFLRYPYLRTEELREQFSPELPNFPALKSIRCLHSEEILDG